MTFLVFTYIRQEDVAKIPMPEAPQNVNSARAITWFVGVTIYCTIFQLQLTSISPVVARENAFEKLAKGKSSFNKLLNLIQEDLGSLAVHVLL